MGLDPPVLPPYRFVVPPPIKSPRYWDGGFHDNEDIHVGGLHGFATSPGAVDHYPQQGPTHNCCSPFHRLPTGIAQAHPTTGQLPCAVLVQGKTGLVRSPPEGGMETGIDSEEEPTRKKLFGLLIRRFDIIHNES